MDPNEEASRLAELLRDDFIDDLTSGEFMPVQLPMVDTGEKITSAQLLAYLIGNHCYSTKNIES